MSSRSCLAVRRRRICNWVHHPYLYRRRCLAMFPALVVQDVLYHSLSCTTTSSRPARPRRRRRSRPRRALYR